MITNRNPKFKTQGAAAIAAFCMLGGDHVLLQDEIIKIIAAWIRKEKLKANDTGQTFYARIKAEGGVEALQELQNELLKLCGTK